jgi:hypothetical protein
MPTIQVQLTADDLMHAVEQLGPPELEQFARRVLALKAHRQALCLSGDETELLDQINRGLPPGLREGYAVLVGKREAQTLSAQEYEELLGLTDQAEELEARRAQTLVELARLRGRPLAALLQDLGIPAAVDG